MPRAQYYLRCSMEFAMASWWKTGDFLRYHVYLHLVSTPPKKNRVLLMLSSPLYSLSAGTIPFCVHPHVTLRRRTLLTSPARKPVLGLRTLWMSLELESFFSSVSSGFTWCSYVFGIVFIICSRLEDVCVCVSILLMVEPIQEPMCNKMLQAKGHQALCLLRFGGWCSWLRMKSGPLTCDWQVPPQIAHGLSMESHGILRWESIITRHLFV